MESAIRQGDKIDYIFTVITTSPSPATTSVAIESSDKLQAVGEDVAIHSDITSTPDLVGVAYVSLAFPTAGAGDITATSWSKLASKTFKDSSKIVISDNGIHGICKFTVTTPATNASGTPDPNTAGYPGTMKLTKSQDKLTSN